ncbi:Imm50 family immunity protein [Hymenobacter endophyticus]|uniref:Imm50 family immunity protein n=1 Tax=Hymenobacter endophyticus TaxID=3076335 RepID=A0ABU3TIT8_9BACT|nr:Imm50 family immunity protein [Hymenobacter endophyticus]MDU0371290.1 Imm50 family immunity protein [Hymenobacter endophyticus]
MAETENPAVSRIINSEIVLQHFGYWPDFHDAEITKVVFETYPTGRYSVTFTIEVWEMVNELDEQGHYKQAKHCLIELQFIGIEEMEFNSFNYQNVIFDLVFAERGSNIECRFDSSNGLEAAIVAEEVLVISLTPTQR